MKKLLLSLGTVAAIAAPVASVIACGSSSSDLDKAKTAAIAGYKKMIDGMKGKPNIDKAVAGIQAGIEMIKKAKTMAELQAIAAHGQKDMAGQQGTH